MSRIAPAIAIDSSNYDAVRELSVAILKRGLIDEWKPKFDKAIACNPQIWVPWRGYLYLQFYRDYDNAIADFDASDTSPKGTDAPQGHRVNYSRGIAYLGKKDSESAIANCNTYIETTTKETGENWLEPTAFLYKAIAYFEARNFEKSELAIDTFLFYNRNKTAEGHYYKARIALSRNDCVLAKERLTLAYTNYNEGNLFKHPYTEVLRQLYIENLEQLKNDIEKCYKKNDYFYSETSIIQKCLTEEN
jgi:tetratricopeptide (TPR) repeat protein